MKNKALVLCSGGPDGLVAAAVLRDMHFEPTLLFFDYGQRSRVAESEAISKASHHMNLNVEVVDLERVFKCIPSKLHGETKVPAPVELHGEAAKVPGRNLVFISVAASIAASHGMGYVAIGNISEGVYADNRRQFTDRFDFLLAEAFEPNEIVRCLAPVVHLNKAQVIDEGMRLGVPFQFTWSCYLGGKNHCGKCGSCVKRKRAFDKLGIIDPVPYDL